MTNNMIAGGFELAGWALVAILIAIFWIAALPIYALGYVLYRMGVIKA